MTFEMAVGKYAGYLQDSYGQGIGGAQYPDKELSGKDKEGNWYLIGWKNAQLAIVKPNGFVQVGF